MQLRIHALDLMLVLFSARKRGPLVTVFIQADGNNYANDLNSTLGILMV